MESMRSLDRSLPGPQEPSEELNGAFKAAAISTTTLYKKAILGQRLARQAGYQDALDDLLSFLDRQNLGLQDGEGWLVRQWATKLLDDRPTTTPSNPTNKEDQHVSDSEEEKEVEKDKSPTPPSREESSPILRPRDIQTDAEKPAAAAPGKPVLHAPPSEAFTFQSSHVYPKDVEMQVIETTSKREVSPRTTRQRKLGKQRSSAGKNGGGGSGGNGSGSKRKLPFGEFFDISDLTDNNGNNNNNGQDGRRPTTRRKLG